MLYPYITITADTLLSFTQHLLKCSQLENLCLLFPGIASAVFCFCCFRNFHAITGSQSPNDVIDNTQKKMSHFFSLHLRPQREKKNINMESVRTNDLADGE